MGKVCSKSSDDDVKISAPSPPGSSKVKHKVVKFRSTVHSYVVLPAAAVKRPQSTAAAGREGQLDFHVWLRVRVCRCLARHRLNPNLFLTDRQGPESSFFDLGHQPLRRAAVWPPPRRLRGPPNQNPRRRQEPLPTQTLPKPLGELAAHTRPGASSRADVVLFLAALGRARHTHSPRRRVVNPPTVALWQISEPSMGA